MLGYHLNAQSMDQSGFFYYDPDPNSDNRQHSGFSHPMPMIEPDETPTSPSVLRDRSKPVLRTIVPNEPSGGRSLHRQGSNASLLSEHLSKAGQYHVQEAASRAGTPSHFRNQSPFRPESPYYDHGQYPSQGNSIPFETVNSLDVDSWRDGVYTGRSHTQSILEDIEQQFPLAPTLHTLENDCVTIYSPTGPTPQNSTLDGQLLNEEQSRLDRKQKILGTQGVLRIFRERRRQKWKEQKASMEELEQQAIDLEREILALEEENDYYRRLLEIISMTQVLPHGAHVTNQERWDTLSGLGTEIKDPASKDQFEVDKLPTLPIANVGVSLPCGPSHHASSEANQLPSHFPSLRSSTKSNLCNTDEGTTSELAPIISSCAGCPSPSPEAVGSLPQHQAHSHPHEKDTAPGYMPVTCSKGKTGSPSSVQNAIGGQATTESHNSYDGKYVTCTICDAVSETPSKLRKHMRRHDRPYGCTFKYCGKAFGSKYDWRRHECFQHNDPSMYRCDAWVSSDTGLEICADVTSTEDDFKRHLREQHCFIDGSYEIWLRKCSVGWDANRLSFWCGFCKEIISLPCQNSKVRNERFDHIAHHFIAENRRIDKWVPVDQRVFIT